MILAVTLAVRLQKFAAKRRQVGDVVVPPQPRQHDPSAHHSDFLGVLRKLFEDFPSFVTVSAAQVAPDERQTRAGAQQVGRGVVVLGAGEVVAETAGVVVDAEQRQTRQLGGDDGLLRLEQQRQQTCRRPDLALDAVRGLNGVFGARVVVVKGDRHLPQQRVEGRDARRGRGVDDDEFFDRRQVDVRSPAQAQAVFIKPRDRLDLVVQTARHYRHRARMRQARQRYTRQRVEVRAEVADDDFHASQCSAGKYRGPSGKYRVRYRVGLLP